MIELYRALRPLKRKIILEKWMHYLLFGGSIGIGIDIIMIILSKLVLISYLIPKLLIVFLVSLVFSSAVLLFRIPTIETVAKKGDSLGFKERFITALYISKDKDKVSNPMYKLALEDAVNEAKNADFNKRYTILFPKKKLSILCLLMLGAIVAGFAPSPVKSKLDMQIEIQEKANEEIKNIEKIQEKLKNNPKLSSKQIKKINKELNLLKADLKKSKTEGDIIRSAQKTQQELKKVSKDSVNQDLKKVGQSLSNHELTRALGDQLQQGNLEEIKKNLEEISKELKNMDQSQVKELADALKEAAKSIENNPGLQQALMDYGKALSNGDYEGLNEEYDKLAQELEDLASQNQELREAIDEINKAMGQNKNQEDSKKQAEGQKQGEGEGQGQGQGQGQGEGQGQGQGQGQGNGQGNGQGEGQSGGQGRGTGHKPNENIYSREAADKQEYEAKVDGQKTNSGDIQEVKQKLIGEKGQSVPYQEVYQKYKQDAIKFLEDDSIPYGIKDLVEEYFSSLE